MIFGSWCRRQSGPSAKPRSTAGPADRLQRLDSAALRTAFACSIVSDLDGRPSCPFGDAAQRDHVAFHLVPGHRPGDGAVEAGVQLLQSSGAEGPRLGGQPTVDLEGGQVAQSAGTEIGE